MNMEKKDGHSQLEKLYCKTLNDVIKQLIKILNEFYFLLAFNLLDIHSEIYRHLYVIISRNNFIFFKDNDHFNTIYSIQLFENAHTWFEYALQDDKEYELTNQITLIRIFKQLHLELNNHKHYYALENTEFNAQTPYYILLLDLLTHFNE